MIASTEFASLGHGEASAFGLPSLPLVLVEHPFGTLSPDEARHAADALIDEIVFAAAGPTDDVDRKYRENVPAPSRLVQRDE